MKKIIYSHAGIVTEKLLSYELLALEIDKLYKKYSLEKANELARAMIIGCGWKLEEFDLEMLKRIDRSWYGAEEPKNQSFLSNCN